MSRPTRVLFETAAKAIRGARSPVVAGTGGESISRSAAAGVSRSSNGSRADRNGQRSTGQRLDRGNAAGRTERTESNQRSGRSARSERGGAGGTGSQGAGIPVKPEFKKYQSIKYSAQATHQTRYVLLHGIPRTATPADVRRALADRNLVQGDFPVTNITSSAMSLPRDCNLWRSFHVALPDAETATAVFEAVQFTDKGHVPLFPDFINESPIKAELVLDSAESWHDAQMDGFEATAWARAARRRELEFIGRDQFDRDFVYGSPELRGKRVLLRGFARGVGVGAAARFIRETLMKKENFGRGGGQESGLVDTVRLPVSTSRTVVIYCATFETVDQAARAFRALNMITHIPPVVATASEAIRRSPDERVIRAEILW